MADVPIRLLFLVGYAHLALAALVGVALAAPSDIFPASLDILLAGAGLVLVASALAYGFAPPFLKREVLGSAPALVALAATGVGTALALVLPLARLDPLDLVARCYAAGFAIVPLHLAASAAWGKPWRGGVALFAKDQPYRRGDALAALFFAASLIGLGVAAALLAWLPRGLPNAGITALLLAHALPFFGGLLVFLLPRNAKTPLPGSTLVGAALAVGFGAAITLATSFAYPVGANFLYPSAGILLAVLLYGFAMLRLKVEKPGVQLTRARPFLRGAAALAVLTGLALVLTMAGGVPSSLLPAAAYAAVLLGATLAIASTLLGAPILLNAVPRDGRWGGLAAALAIAGLFLLAPSYQYDVRSAFPGAALIALAAGIALWGLAPMRVPRRECP